MDKPLARLIKKKRERTQVYKITNKRGEIATNTTEIWLQETYEKLYVPKLDNLEEMDKFLETYKLPKLKQEEIENLNRLITSKEIESVVKNLPINKITNERREITTNTTEIQFIIRAYYEKL